MLICIALLTAVRSTPFGSLQFDTTTTETFNDGTTIDIGWIKFSECNEGYGVDSAPQYDTFSLTELIEIAQQAVTVKIINEQTDAYPGFGEDDQYAIQTDICSGSCLPG